MLDKIISLAKLDVGFFGSLWKSKRAGTAWVWAVACMIFAEVTPNVVLGAVALAAGAFVLGCYQISVGMSDASAMNVAGDAVIDDIENGNSKV